ncbi:hypothetical protein E4T52_15885 [Aureobasidium sp. EXF-3400]|nr:hypothetical protein E4T51_15084 [Aureobasidium sp. EXF-12344]KAI4769055.1 hypothetical protein E4T52_15885 [Aureobasidium sp. EXF-3400]
MHFFTAIFSLFAATATAFPTKPSYLTQPVARDAGDVYVCTGANFTGHCEYFKQALDTCVILPDTLSKQVSAFGPDEGARCLLMQGNCNDRQPYRDASYPGISDLRNSTFDDTATSFICFHLSSTEGAQSV